MTKFELVRKEVEAILPRSPIDFELAHSRLVLKWVLRLKPDADEALRIAAFAHDMERAVTRITEKDLKDYSKIDAFKREHALRSAKFICVILKKHGYADGTVGRVKSLVENHECGGGDADILMDADSLAFFDYNIPSYLKRCGQERAIEKIRFMYKRMSPNAKKLVQSMKFKDAIVKSLVKQSTAPAK